MIALAFGEGLTPISGFIFFYCSFELRVVPNFIIDVPVRMVGMVAGPVPTGRHSSS